MFGLKRKTKYAPANHTKAVLRYTGRKNMPNIEIRCPKCGSPEVKKNQNQEFNCTQCNKTFYFVTPKTHSENNPDRYNL
jgi:transposase-like protein